MSMERLTEIVRNMDIAECEKTNVLVTGQTGSGKTLWTCAIADILMKAGFQVITVDVVGVWKRVSSIPLYQQFDSKTPNYYFQVVLPNESIIYDLSYLLLDEQRRFVNQLCQSLWNFNNKKPLNKTYLHYT